MARPRGPSCVTTPRSSGAAISPSMTKRCPISASPAKAAASRAYGRDACAREGAGYPFHRRGRRGGRRRASLIEPAVAGLRRRAGGSELARLRCSGRALAAAPMRRIGDLVGGDLDASGARRTGCSETFARYLPWSCVIRTGRRAAGRSSAGPCGRRCNRSLWRVRSRFASRRVGGAGRCNGDAACLTITSALAPPVWCDSGRILSRSLHAPDLRLDNALNGHDKTGTVHPLGKGKVHSSIPVRQHYSRRACGDGVRQWVTEWQ
jgi:hypothetical protein